MTDGLATSDHQNKSVEGIFAQCGTFQFTKNFTADAVQEANGFDSYAHWCNNCQKPCTHGSTVAIEKLSCCQNWQEFFTLTSADAPAGSTRPPSHADKSRQSPGPGGGEKRRGGNMLDKWSLQQQSSKLIKSIIYCFVNSKTEKEIPVSLETGSLHASSTEFWLKDFPLWFSIRDVFQTFLLSRHV